jgi:SNF2 family DNA or RNA helicase
MGWKYMTTSSSLFVRLPEPWKPHVYQKKAVKWLLEHAAAALFLDPGLGKTSITLAALKVLKQRGMIGKVLVIAPLRVCYSVWPDEVQKWKDFEDLRVVVLHGPQKEERLREKADIYVINPEGLPWLTGAESHLTQWGTKSKPRPDMARWKSFHFDTLVVDELSKFKHSTTQRFRLLKPILGSFRRRWGLTGSPAANGLMDLFGQAYVLDTGRSLGQYFSHFRTDYFVPTDSHGWRWQLQYGAEERIYERLAPLVLRMAAEDYLELPDLVEQSIKVELPAGARKIYDQLEQELLAKIDGEVVTAATAGVAAMKCRQLANGGVYAGNLLAPLTDQDVPVKEVHTAKVEAVQDLIEELQGQPLLIAYEFKHDRDRLLKALGKETPFIDGDVSLKKSQPLIDAWNRGEIPVLLGQPAAIGHGLNLQGMGNHVCWFSMIWDYEVYDQFIRRVYRQGQKAKQVFVYHIIARNTTDEVVASSLRSKERGQQALFDALKRLGQQRRGR